MQAWRGVRLRPIRLIVIALILGLGLLLLLIIGWRFNVTQAAPPIIGGCPLFPADNIWNVPVNNLPVDANSNAYINSIGANKGLHPDFGSGLWQGAPIGIPYVIVPQNQATVPMAFDYTAESDIGPYPIPPTAPIEGGPSSTGDRHVIVLQQGTCMLFETWSSYPQGGGTSWHAGSGAFFNLNENWLRPAGWTSADAAGLPILPGLARYDEVAAGAINHALRFTINNTRNQYIWPARHKASSNSSPNLPPMGQRFRLKASFNISGYSHDTQVILTALKTYGMIVADNGSDWFISGAPDPGWNDGVLVSELGGITGSNFEAVNQSSLQISPNSAQAAVAPAAPSSPAALTLSSSQINLSWADNAINESGFYIERKTGAAGNYAVVATVAANLLGYNDINLEDNTQYFYRIRAYNAYGTSAYTTPVSATTLLAVPIAPAGLNVWATSATQVSLTWADKSHNESDFAIERSPDGTTGWIQIGALTSPNITTGIDGSLTINTTYFYRIRAHNAAGNTYSDVARVVTTLWPVSNPSDDGAGGNSNMLSYAMTHALTGQSITFAVSGNKVSFNPGVSWSPSMTSGVNLVGGCSGGPTITIDGTGLTSLNGGLLLNHNVVYGIKLTNFPGPGGLAQLRVSPIAPSGTGNRLTCSAVIR